MAEVFNDRATVRVPVKITERLRPGVVAIPWGWWSSQHDDGKVANSLTNDTLHRLGWRASPTATRWSASAPPADPTPTPGTYPYLRRCAR